jgi:hypothetical protein
MARPGHPGLIARNKLDGRHKAGHDEEQLDQPNRNVL